MTGELDPRFAETLAAAEAAPDALQLWDELETLADSQQRPDELGALYRKVLAEPLELSVLEQIGPRALGFHEEWFGDESPHTEELLTRVLERLPTAHWALDRLTMLHTRRGSWPALLGVYDRALENAKDDASRAQLLEQAAQLAKDFAGQPDRAIDYQKQLLALRPRDAKLIASLERLLERQTRWHELIDLWRRRIDASDADAAQLRERIATTLLEHVGDDEATLAEARSMLEGGHSPAHAVDLLERLLAKTSAASDTRRGALALLRGFYAERGAQAEVERVLQLALSFVGESERIAMHRELGAWMAEREENAASLEQYAALLRLDPRARDAEEQIDLLAAKTGQVARHAEAFIAAADRTSDARRAYLLLRAAELQTESDPAHAEQLHRLVLNESSSPASDQQTSARALVKLLAAPERDADRLDIYERLAKLETERTDQARVLGEGARLAESIGALNRALAAWQTRLDFDGSDLEALNATIEILQRDRRWPQLIQALRARKALPMPAALRRTDSIQIARTYENELQDRNGAIETWLEIQREFGDDPAVTDSLHRLLERESRWRQLAEVLAPAVARDEARAAETTVRLADVRRLYLSEPLRAADGYHQALKLDPRHEGARKGLRAVVAVDEARASALEGLAEAAHRTDDYEALLSLLEDRLRSADNDRTRVRLLKEAAELEEHRRGDAMAALRAVHRAFVLLPDDETLEKELIRLGTMVGEAQAGETGEGNRAVNGWSEVVRALRVAVPMLTHDSRRVATIHRRIARLCEVELGDADGALDELKAAFALEHHDLPTAHELVRIASQRGDWVSVADSLVRTALSLRRVDRDLLDRIEAAADEAMAWQPLASAAADAMIKVAEEEQEKGASAPRLAELGRAIETRIAVWERDRRGDLERAEAALARAVRHEPGHIETLRELAKLRWREPSRDLIETLLAISERNPDDLDPLHDASRVALDPVGDVVLANQILRRLFRESVRLWERKEPAKGERPADQTAIAALDEMIRLSLEADEVAEAIDLLSQGTRLPVAASEARAYRRRAGDLARERLADENRAMRLYQSIADESLEDAYVVDRLATMYEARGRIPELLALRQRELGEPLDDQRRWSVRLEVARLLGQLETSGGRLDMLRKNLSERPGHDASVSEVITVLESKGKSGELADLLTIQARNVEGTDPRRGALLWAKVASLCEDPLKEPDRAIAAHRRVVALEPTAIAYDSLAELYLAKGDNAQAAEWLEKRLELARGAERTPIALRLAAARVGEGRVDRALAVLERALNDEPAAREVRERLAELYRNVESWEPLARLLADGVGYLDAGERQLEYVREAADIYAKHLDRLDRAIPILEVGVELAPHDSELRTALGVGLRVAGQLDRAREIFEKLIADFGRRRSPERAALHFELAKVAHAAGDLDAALDDLDRAASMDLGHAGVLRMLGDLAREAGLHDRAERAYRALLLLVRRQASEGREPKVGVAEVLYELSRLARARDQAEQAEELLDSAFEAASQNPADAARFTRALMESGETELALRTVSLRLEGAPDERRRAQVLADRAEIRERQGDDLDAAWTDRVEAFELVPTRAYAEAARSVAARTDKTRELLDRITERVDRMRRKEDVAPASDLLMVAGEIAERELTDFDAAASCYRRVEELGERTLEAWRALARVASLRKDHVEEIRVLRRLVAAGVDASELGGVEIPEEAQTEAFYRIAEVELGSAATLETGLSTLRDALSREPDHARAARILHPHAVRLSRGGEPHEGLLSLYERAARGSGDRALTLAMLEVLVAGDSATIEQVREAFGLASELAPERVPALLQRGIEIAEASEDGLVAQLWLPIALADARRDGGDIAGALEWRTVAARAAEKAGDPERAKSLLRELADVAVQPGGDPALGAEVFRKLATQDPSDRTLWEPLSAVHRQLGDRAGFESVIVAMLDGLIDPSTRSDLRLLQARYLLEAGAESDATAVLGALVEEDPDSHAAAGLLADLYERNGRNDDLAELLGRQLDRARDHRDHDAIAALTLRMGGLLSANRPTDARDLYRQGLDWAPEDPRLLRALLEASSRDDDPRDHALLSERLLGVEQGEAAVELARGLADWYTEQEDEYGALRVLDLGYKRAPQSDELRSRLESQYRSRDDLTSVADLIAFDAAHREAPHEAIGRWREAANLYVQLDRPEDAIVVLRKAREVDANDSQLLDELVRALGACSRPEEAIAELSSALERHPEPTPARAALLRQRSSYRMPEESLVDLEAAYAIDPESSFEPLVAALGEARNLALGDQAREIVIRLAALLGAHEQTDMAREVLADWSYREPHDVGILRSLYEMDRAQGRWSDVLRHCARLVDLEQGEAQIAMAEALLDAANRTEQPDHARAGLERVYRDQPREPRVRAAIRSLFESMRAYEELANLLLEDALEATDRDAKFESLRRAGELFVYEVGNPGRAVEPLQTALALRDDEPDTIVILSDALIGCGALAEAVELLQHAISNSKRRRSPALANMQVRMARIAGHSGDHQTQLEWLKVAMESDKSNSVIAAELAELAMAMGDDTTALGALKVVTLQKTQGPMTRALAFLRQAQIAHRQGDHQKAVLWARRARIEDSELKEAEEFLNAIGEG